MRACVSHLRRTHRQWQEVRQCAHVKGSLLHKVSRVLRQGHVKRACLRLALGVTHIGLAGRRQQGPRAHAHTLPIRPASVSTTAAKPCKSSRLTRRMKRASERGAVGQNCYETLVPCMQSDTTRTQLAPFPQVGHGLGAWVDLQEQGFGEIGKPSPARGAMLHTETRWVAHRTLPLNASQPPARPPPPGSPHLCRRPPPEQGEDLRASMGFEQLWNKHCKSGPTPPPPPGLLRPRRCLLPE